MLEHKEQITISLTLEQRRALTDMAHRQGQQLVEFIENTLQKLTGKKSSHVVVLQEESLRETYDSIRKHRRPFPAKRTNAAIAIDTETLLEQIRDQHDEQLHSLDDGQRR